MIWHDYSYIKSMFAVEHGYAKIDVHSLRLSVVLTEEQKEANREFARETLDAGNHEAWNIRCKESQAQKAGLVFPVINALSKRFKMYQFSDEESAPSYKDKWELFFWCNDKGNTMRDDKESGRDYSYVTLSFNDRIMTYEERSNLLAEVLDYIEELETDIDVAVQHDLFWDKDKVSKTVKEFCEGNIGKMINCGYGEGKIRKLSDGGFGFFKKGAKKYGYHISDDDTSILRLAIEYATRELIYNDVS